MKLAFTYWQDGSDFLGYLDDFPDYETQGSDLQDLQEHLIDLYQDLTSGEIPHVKHHGELMIS
jgi:predicted RNase H-like HicB family nuclease